MTNQSVKCWDKICSCIQTENGHFVFFYLCQYICRSACHFSILFAITFAIPFAVLFLFWYQNYFQLWVRLWAKTIYRSRAVVVFSLLMLQRSLSKKAYRLQTFPMMSFALVACGRHYFGPHCLFLKGRSTHALLRSNSILHILELNFWERNPSTCYIQIVSVNWYINRTILVRSLKAPKWLENSEPNAAKMTQREIIEELNV